MVSLHLLRSDEVPPSRGYLIEVLVAYMERRSSQIDALNEMPLYPTEKVGYSINITIHCAGYRTSYIYYEILYLSVLLSAIF